MPKRPGSNSPGRIEYPIAARKLCRGEFTTLDFQDGYPFLKYCTINASARTAKTRPNWPSKKQAQHAQS